MRNALSLGGGAKVLMPETFNTLARVVGPAALPVTDGMIAHNASTQHADDINRYASIANNSDSEVEITAADRMAANSYGWFDESYAAEASAVNHIAKGRALEREGKIGKAVVLRTMPVLDTETSALLKGIDTSSDRPAITDFSTHYRPKSILSTPDQSAELAELNRLPGFSPSMLKTLQESFPDDSQKLEEFNNLPGFTPIHTSAPTVETFPIHEEDISDLILYKEEKQILDNTGKIAGEYIDEQVSGSVRREFPGEYLDKTIKEILEDAGNGKKNARKAKKLLTQKRFLK